MAKIALRGMTWDHRRAVDPLLTTLPEFRRLNPDIEIDWSARPLHGFEFTPVEQLARAYDLVILDHPFVGDVAAKRYLLPLDGLVDQALEGAFVGPSLPSYRYGGFLWAVPVDAACQVAVARPDLLAGLDSAPPQSWGQMTALGARARRQGMRLAIALKGVHGLMTFFTLCANLGRGCGHYREEPFVDRATGCQALEAMRELLQFCPTQVLDWSSIALHDAMVAADDLVFCPAVYLYATYAEADTPRPLRFFDIPSLKGASPCGSTIGGTGIGVSRYCAEPEAALAYVRYLIQSATQKAFAAHHGQPARSDAWEDAEINARFGNAFWATRATMDAAWVRPRYAGYLAFQARGGELVEQHLRGHLDSEDLLDRLAALHASAGREEH
jgi:multiple sugar transport system substrate-binding protein